VHWRGQQAVVTLPDHIDVSNASRVGEGLLSVISHGAIVLIVDMTATIECDHAGANALVRACRQSAAVGTQLRLVVTAQAVRRVLALNGLDRVIPVYASLTEATAAETPLTGVAVTPEPGTGRAPQRSQPSRAAAPTAGMTMAFGRPGLDWTVVLRRQPARIVAGRAEGGYTNMFEIICYDCGDNPDLDYRDVPSGLQRIRGPYPITAGVAAYERHLTKHPNRRPVHQSRRPLSDLTADDRQGHRPRGAGRHDHRLPGAELDIAERKPHRGERHR
jgi:anti-anti-sigma factor